MERDYSPNWMWSEACEMLVRAERLHRQFFEPRSSARRGPSWEPPVDVIETATEVLIFAALPGVAPDQAEAIIDAGHLILSGARLLPRELATAAIHRLELPQGQFFRRIALPPGRYSTVRRSSIDGCLVIALKKAEPGHGQ